jgi:hypothetical protein
MFRFKTLDSNSHTNYLYIQGARAEDTSNDIAGLVFQNYDHDTRKTYNMADIAVIDQFGNDIKNGIANMVFRTNPLGDSNHTLEMARLTYDGNFLIGTKIPYEKLTINGSTSVSGQYLASNNTSNQPSFSWINDKSTGIFQPSSNMIGFSTLSNERMRITSTGNIAINTTQPPKERLEVVGNILATNVQKITKTVDSLQNLDIQLNWQYTYPGKKYNIILESYQQIASDSSQAVRYQRHTINVSSSNPTILTQQNAQVWGDNDPLLTMSIRSIYSSPSNIILRASTSWNGQNSSNIHHSYTLNTVLVPDTSNIGQVWLS